MDLATFVQSLTEKEKRDLFLILKREFNPNEPETVKESFQRHLEDDRMSTRLRTAFGEAIMQKRQFPESSCLHKAVKDLKFDDLYRWRGMGRKTWQEFVALRGY